MTAHRPQVKKRTLPLHTQETLKSRKSISLPHRIAYGILIMMVSMGVLYAASGTKLLTNFGGTGVDFITFFSDASNTQSTAGVDAKSLHASINDSWFPFPLDNQNYLRGNTVFNGILKDEQNPAFSLDPSSGSTLNNVTISGSIVGLTPVAGPELATKAYVDAKTLNAGGANYGGGWGGTGGIILQEFQYNGSSSPQYGCPSGWVYVGTMYAPGGINSVCGKGSGLYQYSTDKDGDGLTDINSVAYGKAYNGMWQSVNLKGYDLNPGYPDNSAQKSGTVFYRAFAYTGTATITRASADAFCASKIPGGKSLTNIHAMISLSTNDEIRDMPNNYGYNPYRPIWFLDDNGLAGLANNGSTLVDSYVSSDWITFLTDGLRVSPTNNLTISNSVLFFLTNSNSDGTFISQSPGYFSLGILSYASAIAPPSMLSQTWNAYGSLTNPNITWYLPQPDGYYPVGMLCAAEVQN